MRLGADDPNVDREGTGTPDVTTKGTHRPEADRGWRRADPASKPVSDDPSETTKSAPSRTRCAETRYDYAGQCGHDIGHKGDHLFTNDHQPPAQREAVARIVDAAKLLLIDCYDVQAQDELGEALVAFEKARGGV